MPAFKFLSPEDRWKLTAHVLRFSDLLDSPEPEAVAPPKHQHQASPETIAAGKKIYEEQQCHSCHGALGKGDGPSSKTLKDSEGHALKARDLTAGIFRGGSAALDLYYRISTGMGGTPMPAYGELLDEDQRWALVDYVMSLRAPQKEIPVPKDPLKAGRALAAKYGCRGCHVLDDGKGGNTGPDLRISAQKLGTEWVRNFLHDPRAYGKIYPWRPAQMPNLGLSEAEIEVAAKYLTAMSKRKKPELAPVDPSTFPAAALEEGKNLFVMRCMDCHALGKVIETPVVKQQGPDLIRVGDRIHFDWAKAWIIDPKKVDPATKMTVPGLTPAQVEAVRMFVWKTSLDASKPQRAAK